jgi:hypothetical protein
MLTPARHFSLIRRMDPSDPAAPYLPTVERARSEGLELPPGEPAAQQRLAILLVYAALLRRRTWFEDTVIPWDRMAQFERGAPPAPTDFAPRSHARIEQEISMDTCPSCTATPGRMKCRVCKGAGSLTGMKLRCSCDEGYVPCPICHGERLSQRVRLRYYNDEPVWFREAYVPTPFSHVPSLFSFESKFEKTIDIDAVPPECLRCHDLGDRVAGATAYRGGERRQKPDFKGHDFSDTIDKALAGLAALSVGVAVPLYELRAYAWPVLWLHYEEGLDLAIFTGRDGLLQTFGG